MILAALYQHFVMSWPLKRDGWAVCNVGSWASPNRYVMYSPNLLPWRMSASCHQHSAIGASNLSGKW